MTTTILPSTGLTSLLVGKILFLDTNVFVGALLCDDLALFLADLRKSSESQVLTVSSAVYEFTRGSKTLEEFNDKREFVNDLTDRVMPVGPLLENSKNDVFSLVMSRMVSSRDSDYTDFLLATCLYQYSRLESVYLMTSDVRSMPRNIFDVVGSVTCSDKEALRHYVVYCLNDFNFNSAVKSQLKKAAENK